MELREDDLRVAVCPKCRGERLVWDPPEPVRNGWRQQVTCPACDGRGVQLTPTGARLFDFIHEVMRHGPR